MKFSKTILFFIFLFSKLSYGQIDASRFYGIYKYNNEFQISILYFQKGGICVDTVHGPVSHLATGTYFFERDKIIATFIKSDNSISKRTFFLVHGNNGKVSLEEKFWYKTQKRTGLRKEKSSIRIYRKIAEIDG